LSERRFSEPEECALSSYPPDELDFYVNVAGIPARDVLRWATRNGAELMGRGHELGALRPGMLADLLIVDGDPLADIRVLQRRENIVAILKDGRFEKNLLAPPTVSGAERARRAG
jgi:imidazolonepropionase-like amidohydrolase